ncbi:hypothetical protein AB0M32_09595 [Streptomyces sp. NPDC051985]|uniref:hypothetical protein n=1 Tax=Streptomyces sp. NPDC051985 TaxID=3155807 RepID=UPI00341BB005
MRTTIATAVVTLAGALLTGCTQGSDAAAEAAAICRDMGFGSDGSTPPQTGSTDWQGMADGTDRFASWAAAAAAKDPRWIPLAGELKKMSAIADRYRDMTPAPVELSPLDSVMVADSSTIVRGQCQQACAAS